jgi:hypothetical protein
MENLKILKEILEFQELSNTAHDALWQLQENFERDITLLKIELPDQIKISDRKDDYFDFIHTGDTESIYLLNSIEFRIELKLTPYLGIRNGAKFKAHPIIRFNYLDSFNCLKETSFAAKNKIDFYEETSTAYASIKNSGYDSDETILLFEKGEDFAKIKQYLQMHTQKLLDFFREAF